MKLSVQHLPIDKFKELLNPIQHLDISIFVDDRPKKQEDLSPINILVLQEPNEYFGHHEWAIQNKHLFSIIITWSDRVLSNCENALFLPFGSSWITEEIAAQPRTKSFSIGHLCGDKLLTFGHSLRHEIFHRKNEIKIPTNFLYKGETVLPKALITKEQIFGNPMFAVVIENTSHHGYFTEKITDCMMLKTIPLYWGCSNIERFYNKEGIIFFRSADELIKISNTLTPEYYQERINVINENFNKVNTYQKYETRVAEKIISVLKYNKLID